MGKKSNFQVVCVEGATCDGRHINRQDIQDIADTYDPKVYNARVNLEHINGVLPNGPFKAYGDVAAVKAEEITDGPLAGKLALKAQIDATDDLVEMNRARQKVHTSVEFRPNFAKTGRSYLTGLAVTDNPASLGTEILQFSANAAVNPLAMRKTDAECLFTAAHEVAFSFEEAPEEKPSIFSRVKELLSRRDQASDRQLEDVHLAVTELAQHQQAQGETLAGMAGLRQTVTALSESMAQQQSSLAGLTQKLSSTDASPLFRPPATGAASAHETDC